ncbi:MAG: MFS transporter, partial [Robiginitomaculum sp.]|nr:MFS transporter [Robiginitomaculum sp.]
MTSKADISNVDEVSVKFGPVHLEPGVTRWNARTYMFSAFWTIGFLSFLSFLQNYILKEHLGIAGNELGRAVGNLALVGEIVLLTVSPFFGALSDKIGRRPIFAMGFLWIGAGFLLYPLASSFSMLLVIKAFMGVGAAALAGMMATVLSDYPQNRSRGIMAAMSGLCNGFGALFMILVLSQLPKLYASKGMSAQEAGTLTFWTLAVMAIVTAGLVFRGLKSGKPGKPQKRKKLPILVKEGFGAAKKNPRLQLALAESFIARGDILMIGTFLSLWLIHTGTNMHGLEITEATKHAGRMSGIVHASALLWTPFFGLILDKFDRATGVVFAMALA